MKHKNYFEFNLIRPSRLVWEDTPEENPPPAADAGVAKTAEDPGAQAAAEAEGALRADASKEGHGADAGTADAALKQNLDQQPSDTGTADKPAGVEEKPKEPPKYTPEQVTGALQKYPDAYKAFLADKENKDVEARKQNLLKLISDQTDKAIVEWALSEGPTEWEKDEITKKFEGKDFPTEHEKIDELTADGTLNAREANVIKAMLSEKTTESSGKWGWIGGMFASLAAALKELAETIKNWLKTDGKNLVDQIQSALGFEKKKEPAALTHSPFGEGVKARKLPDYKGLGIALITEPGQAIHAVTNGKLVVDNGTIVLTQKDTNAQIRYSNVALDPKLQGQKDITITSGQAIGTAKTGTSIQMRVINNKGDELVPGTYLNPYLSDEGTAAAPAAPPQPT